MDEYGWKREKGGEEKNESYLSFEKNKFLQQWTLWNRIFGTARLFEPAWEIFHLKQFMKGLIRIKRNMVAECMKPFSINNSLAQDKIIIFLGKSEYSRPHENETLWKPGKRIHSYDLVSKIKN